MSYEPDELQEVPHGCLDAEQVEAVGLACRKYGKGRHPAGPNYGDLFAYALATTTVEPLLFKGDDFSKTDASTR